LILDGCDGSLVNLVNMVNLVNWLFTIDNRLMVNLDPRLRHSGTSLEFGLLLPEAKKVAPI